MLLWMDLNSPSQCVPGRQPVSSRTGCAGPL